MLSQKIREGIQLEVEDFHSQWRLNGLGIPHHNAVMNQVRAQRGVQLLRELNDLPNSERRAILQNFGVQGQRIQEPGIVNNGRGRPQGALNRIYRPNADARARRVEARDPSAFEVADERPRRQRLCKKCRQPGHNIATCRQLLDGVDTTNDEAAPQE